MKVLITGTTNGIGVSILEYMVENGYDIYTINRRNSQMNNVKNYICDLSDIDQTKNTLNLIKNIDFDVIINNAGSGKVSKIEQLTYEDILKEVTLNFITPLLLIKEFYPKMILKKYSRIINISSISAKQGTPFLYVYSASKAALDSLTQSVARTQPSEGFTINSICPGGIDTKMSITGRSEISILKRYTPDKYQNEMIESMRTKRLISTEEVVNLIDFLMDPKSNVINGQSINICGTMEVK